MPETDKLPEPGCKWVKAGWALQPTDFILDHKGRITAGQNGIEWSITRRDFLWQRPKNTAPDTFHIMKEIKKATYLLPSPQHEQYVWRMQQVLRKAGAELLAILAEGQAAYEKQLKTMSGGV